MNTKAQLAPVAFMMAVVIVILALAFMFPLNELVTSVMGNAFNGGEAGSGLDCSVTTNDFVKATCWVMDIGQAYFIGGLLALAGIIIGAKIMFSGGL